MKKGVKLITESALDCPVVVYDAPSDGVNRLLVLNISMGCKKGQVMRPDQKDRLAYNQQLESSYSVVISNQKNLGAPI